MQDDNHGRRVQRQEARRSLLQDASCVRALHLAQVPQDLRDTLASEWRNAARHSVVVRPQVARDNAEVSRSHGVGETAPDYQPSVRRLNANTAGQGRHAEALR